MVSGALRVTPSCLSTFTSGAGDLGRPSFVHPFAALAGREGGHWRVRDRKWCSLLSRQASPMLRVYSTWQSVGYSPFLFVSVSVSVSDTVAVVSG